MANVPRKIVLLGANGQVGAELCLVLSAVPDLEVVPVCRNRMGSAFLRFNGLKCMHGDISQADEAEELLSGCDVVVNLVLPDLSNNYRVARKIHERIIRNTIDCSDENASIIYCSSMSVYGDQSVNEMFAFSNLYGHEKRRGELLCQRIAGGKGKSLFILRLGHVFGEIQGISLTLREMMRNGALCLDDTQRESNVVYVSTIADCIVSIARGDICVPGIYDLMNRPQWPWQQVIEYEASRIGITPEIRKLNPKKGNIYSAIAAFVMRCIYSLIQDKTIIRKMVSRFMAWMPTVIVAKLKRHLSAKKAALEIGLLVVREQSLQAFNRKPVKANYPEGLDNTTSALKIYRPIALNPVPEQSEQIVQ